MHLLDVFINWLHNQSWLELTGVFTGLLCVYLAAINNIWNWPFAIINTGIYIYIFAKTALYADMFQNTYLFCINIYGWYYWSRQSEETTKVQVVLINRKQVIILALLAALASPVLGYTLVNLTKVLHYDPPAFPYLDSFCTVISLTAQVYMARKIVQNWLIWIFVDIIYVAIYVNKGLEPTAFMYGIYAVLAAKGYFDWRKDYRNQQLSA